MYSNFKYKFEDSGLEWALSVEDSMHFFACYRRLMRHWERVLPGRVLTVQYEHLVQDPRAAMVHAPLGERTLSRAGLGFKDE